MIKIKIALHIIIMNHGYRYYGCTTSNNITEPNVLIKLLINIYSIHTKKVATY